MKILVISDTHGELDNVKQILDIAKKENVNLVIHLGDDVKDVEILEKEGLNVVKVPGVFEDIYRKPETKRRIVLELHDLKLLLSHTDTRHENDLPSDIDPQEALSKGEVQVLLHGHTHIPKIELRGDKLIINPGHLKKSDKKGYPPTYAIIEINDVVKVQIRNLFTGETLSRIEILKKFLTKKY